MTSSRQVVSDTSPLISLEKIEGGYEWGQKMYETILVPPAVLRELAAGMTDDVDDYLTHFGISDLLCVEAPASSDLG